MNQIADERLMTITDLSTMLGVPVDTLYGWRHRGQGPRGYRVGRHVRYRRSSVEAWLEEQADRRQPARDRRMAHIERRRIQRRDSSGRLRVVTRYRVRYRGGSGKQHCETKMRLVDRFARSPTVASDNGSPTS